MTLTERQVRFTFLLGKLLSYASETLNLDVKITELNRLLETQKDYVARGVSKTMDSCHLLNLAVDLYIIKDGAPTKNMEDYRQLGVYWECIGGRWGGRFGVPEAEWDKRLGWDCPHFECR